MKLARVILRLTICTGLAFFMIACSDSNDGSRDNDDPLTLRPLKAKADVHLGGAVVDDQEREVLMRGVNVNSLVEYWQGNEFPTTFPFTESDAKAIAAIGWNTVLLLVSWSRIEPEPGIYDDAYLDEVEAMVDLLARFGIYSIIDLHQDAWNASLAAREDEQCNGDSKPGFGWDGAPAWATLVDPNTARCAFGLREANAAVIAAWRAFFNNEPGPQGVGIGTRYAQMLGHVAYRFSNKVAVAGYDLMNEPNALTDGQVAGLTALYAAAIEEIRAGEHRGNGFNHLVFFEPSILWLEQGYGAPLPFTNDENIVYAPHIYTGGFDGGPITPEPFEAARNDAIQYNGAPVFIGEWGTNPDRAGPRGDGYFLRHQRYQDEFHFGAALWTWRESCGDPHKAGEFRTGLVPQVWGEFDVDCDTNEVQGERIHLIEELTRATLRAAPGRIETMEYANDSGEFRAQGQQAIGGQLVVFYPSARFGRPAIQGLQGLTNQTWHDAPGGNDYLTADSNASAWSLELMPSK